MKSRYSVATHATYIQVLDRPGSTTGHKENKRRHHYRPQLRYASDVSILELKVDQYLNSLRLGVQHGFYGTYRGGET